MCPLPIGHKFQMIFLLRVRHGATCYESSAKKAVAIALMADGFSNDAIAKYSGLSLDEIQKLHEENKH